MAPETITEKESSFASDWWAVGVILHEMLLETPPFKGKTPEEVFNSILTKEDLCLPVGYNDDQISPDAASLITGLLTKDPTKRLGYKGASEIKIHGFFEGIDWKNLRSITPPFVPQTAHITDTSYFKEGAKDIVKDFEMKEEKEPPVILKAERKNSDASRGSFDTTNAKILAEMNKEDAKKILIKVGSSSPAHTHFWKEHNSPN